VSKFYEGLPPINARCSGGSQSISSVSDNHEPARITISKKFRTLHQLPQLDFESRIWTKLRLNKTTSFAWDSENSIKTLVMEVLADAIEGAGLFGKVDLKDELGIYGLQPDMLVVLVEGFPVGVVEVKKPGEGVVSDPRVLGQMYDYLLRLSSFYGLKHVFNLF
jgi:hypothetical protein